MSAANLSDKHRLRAAKACQRCNQRKVKCDATQLGFPCSRCRMDNNSDYVLLTSKRGTYDRRLRLKRHEARTAETPSPSYATEYCEPTVTTPRHAPDDDDNDDNDDDAPDAAAARNGSLPLYYSLPALRLLENNEEHASSVSFSRAQMGRSASSNTIAPLTATTAPATTLSRSVPSLSSMFQDFVGKQGEEPLKAELVLFGESSPLTFSLQLRREADPSLHDISHGIYSSRSLPVIQKDGHPAHLAPYEIECLKAKGTFESPGPEVLEDMFNVFLDRFYPLYPVVDPIELRQAYEKRKVPWILLQSLCFIAVTFGDAALIYKAGFRSRVMARRLFYHRAKALFDFNYENNKIILLKVTILLSFKGPQMDYYWHPCSWIEVGVTVAVSLGMHRKAAYQQRHPDDRALLKRLWWILSLRDAHCSVLLGRPFRINITQCDVDMLTLDEFVDIHTREENSATHDCDCQAAFQYQIHVAELSLILRTIVLFRFGPGSEATSAAAIQAQLDTWKIRTSAGPVASVRSRGPPISIWRVQMETLLNYHTMLLYMDPPVQGNLTPAQQHSSSDSPVIAYSSALAISSAAVKLVTKASLCALPHEIFPAFFTAGILLYRQAQQAGEFHVAKMMRASFDNCQMLLNEAQASWDPGRWAMKIFSFLLSGLDESDPASTLHQNQYQRPQDGVQQAGAEPEGDNLPIPAIGQGLVIPTGETAWSPGLGLPCIDDDRDSMMDITEYMLLPNFFGPPYGN